MVEDHNNHVSRKISGRKITAVGVDTTADYGRCIQNNGRQHFNQRTQQPSNSVFDRTSSMEMVKAGHSKSSSGRQHPSQGDGRWNDRFGRGIVSDMNRLSLRNSAPLENCFEQLRMMEKFRVEVSTTITF